MNTNGGETNAAFFFKLKNITYMQKFIKENLNDIELDERRRVVEMFFRTEKAGKDFSDIL